MANDMHMPATERAVYSGPYRDALAQAAASGKPIMAKLLQMLLPYAENRQRKLHALDALEQADLSVKLLREYGQALCEQFPTVLLAAFTKSFQPARSEALAAPRLHFDQLELMALDQVQESIVLAQTQQAIVLAVDTALVELNTYICAAQGLSSVRPELNPVRPEVFLQALQDLIRSRGVPSAIRQEWVQQSASLLGRELCTLYLALTRQLRADRVAAVGFAVARNGGSGAAGQGGTAGGPHAPGPAPSRVPVPGQIVLTLDKLNQLLSGDFDLVPSTDGFAPTQLDTPTLTLSPLSSLSGAPVHPGHAIGQEVVRLMVDNIASDTRLLEPVQDIVRDLEPTLLKLASADPRFLSDKQHPARQLLDKITHLSQAYHSVLAPGFEDFQATLHRSLEPLVEPGLVVDSSAAPFDLALDALQAPNEADAAQRQRAMDALQQAEQRNLLAQKIAQEWADRSDVQQAPQAVFQFINGPWAQVAAHVQLTDKTGAPDPGKVNTTLDALLWSAQPALTRKNIGKLTRLVPKLLTHLREGLALIAYPQADTEAFFESLFALHQQAFKPLPAKPAPAPVPPPATEEPPADDWMAPREVAATGFMLDLPPSLREPLPDDPLSVRGALVDGSQPDQPMVVGNWVELLLQGSWVRTQLTWTTPHGSMFLFTDASGNCQSMTKRSRDKRVLDGTMRALVQHAVVDDALDAVAQTAMRNSIDAILNNTVDNILI